MTRNMRTLAMLGLLSAMAVAGCVGDDDTIRIAFVGKDTALEPHEHPDRLAEWVSEQTGRPAEAFFFDSSSAAIEAVRFGQADFASVDGAAGWLAWQRLGLEAIASEVRADGRTHYIAAAWVHANSTIQDVGDLADVRSCHTGATKSAGMFLPMGYLVREGFIDASSYADDISQVQEMAKDFFDEPVIGGAYADYNGALRCLSEGVGDVAFVRDTTPADYCPGEDWCLEPSEYRMLVGFGPVPEHPIMVNPALDAARVQQILDALLALNDDDDGRAILSDVFGTHGIAQVQSTEAHLSDYGDLVRNLPGMERYAESQ